MRKAPDWAVPRAENEVEITAVCRLCGIPHNRHTAAMLWRAKGVDIATIALLLGHESTQTTHIYEHADPALKEEAIARTAPLGIKPGRYRPSDTLLAFLDGL